MTMDGTAFVKNDECECSRGAQEAYMQVHGGGRCALHCAAILSWQARRQAP